jgi:hypothetical protein
MRSNFREIPDHQEVYGNIDTDQSIIIEILSTPSWPDEVSAENHFKDLAETNDCSPEDSVIHQISTIDLPNFEGDFSFPSLNTTVTVELAEYLS